MRSVFSILASTLELTRGMWCACSDQLSLGSDARCDELRASNLDAECAREGHARVRCFLLGEGMSRHTARASCPVDNVAA